MPQQKQTRKGSMVEAISNVAVGYSVAFVSQVVFFPIVGVQASLQQNIIIGAIFTVVSIARSFVLRRAFEALRIHGVVR